MRTKKWSSIILVICMLVVMFPISPVQAETEEQITITANPLEGVKAGQEVVCTVSVKNNGTESLSLGGYSVKLARGAINGDNLTTTPYTFPANATVEAGAEISCEVKFREPAIPCFYGNWYFYDIRLCDEMGNVKAKDTMSVIYSAEGRPEYDMSLAIDKATETEDGRKILYTETSYPIALTIRNQYEIPLYIYGSTFFYKGELMSSPIYFLMSGEFPSGKYERPLILWSANAAIELQSDNMGFRGYVPVGETLTLKGTLDLSQMELDGNEIDGKLGMLIGTDCYFDGEELLEQDKETAVKVVKGKDPSIPQTPQTPQNPQITQPEKTPEEKNTVTKISGIKLTGISKNIAYGKKIQLKAAVTPTNATNKSVTWRTSNKRYATVTQKGVVSLKKAGAGKTVTITATAKDGSGKKATYKIKIMKHSVKSISLKAAKSVKAGRKITVKATVKTTGKKVNKKLIWSTSNKKYATVTAKGVVKTYKAGKRKTVRITAKATDGSNKKKTIKIRIK